MKIAKYKFWKNENHQKNNAQVMISAIYGRGNGVFPQNLERETSQQGTELWFAKTHRNDLDLPF
jgi:hypothetical protein